MTERPGAANRPRDEGAVLPLILVLTIVAALVVLPVMSYTLTVLRSNKVVSERTKDLEAVKGGLRVALAELTDVFNTCDSTAGTDLAMDPVVNGMTVDNRCALVEEIGPLEALGYEVPTGAVALQLGASVPITFSGTTAASGPVPPYPVSPDRADWWSGQESVAAAAGTIWMPRLPRVASVDRAPIPFDMPAGFGCKVFLPGRYDDPITISTGQVYFASGVYSFSEPVTIEGDADVVVGYGLEDFGTGCADDIQIATNVLGEPGTFAIDGGGATWVFGGNGRLVVDDATGSPSVRFNQRYAEESTGGRISIMTVNGGELAGADHDVPDVNLVPRSMVRIDDGNPDASPPVAPTDVDIDGFGYVPSAATLTDAVRTPRVAPSLGVTTRQYLDGATHRGALQLEWTPVSGQDAGGGWIDDEITLTPPAGTGCEPDDVIADRSTGSMSCTVRGLSLGTTYDVAVAAVNVAGAGPPATTTARPEVTDPVLAVPDPPADVRVESGAADDVALVAWAPPASNGAPIVRYDVAAYRVHLEGRPNLAPVAESPVVHVPVGAGPTTRTMPLPVTDPNGDLLAVAVDTSGLPPEITAVQSGSGVTFTVAETAPVPAMFVLPYTASDPEGLTGSGSVVLVVDPAPTSEPAAPDLTVTPNLAVTTTFAVPAHDPDLEALTVSVDASGFDPLEWTFVEPTLPNDLHVAVTTTAADGTYALPYTVSDAGGRTATGTITIDVARSQEQVGTCATVRAEDRVVPTACEIPLPDIVAGDGASGNIGYRFDVVATNAGGASASGSNPAPYPLAFDGGGAPLPVVSQPVLEAWIPEPIVEVRAGGPGVAVVSVAGYVAVPMGRIEITNPDGDPVALNGGVLAGTFGVVDGREVPGSPGSLPIGFSNDIVLQRTIRITSTAGNARSVAIVQINEDGAGYAINSWVVG